MEKVGNITIIEATSRFKKVDISLIENENIDCLTLGIYTKLIVLGKKWNLNVRGLRSHLGLSDEKVRKALSLLEQEGYIVRTPCRDEKGHLLGWNYTIYPVPVNEDERSKAGKGKENQQVGLPSSPIPDHSDNGGLINNRKKETLEIKEPKEEKDKSFSKKERIDYDAIVKCWNETNPTLSNVRMLNEDRKKQIRNLLASNNATVDDLMKAIKIISMSSFCQGKNDRNWRASFDWLIKDTKSCFSRLFEGVYAFTQDEKNKLKQYLGQTANGGNPTLPKGWEQERYDMYIRNGYTITEDGRLFKDGKEIK